MEARPAEGAKGADAPDLKPASWTKPLVRLDELWTKIETFLVLAVLLAAILYMTGWVTLNAFHTKGGRLANFPGIILVFTGLASAVSWTRVPPKDRHPRKLVLPGVLFAFGVLLLLVAKKQDYFANVSRWLADASLIKQMGTPQIVSARLFTIWVALLGGSLATGAGRQINIDVVMRFIGPKPRLAVAMLGYTLASIACFTVAWGFVDYLAITRYGATKVATKTEKLATIGNSLGRHSFVVRRQLMLDARSFGKVVIGAQPFDKWYSGAEWNKELNEAGWASVYPPPPPAPGAAAPAVPYPTKPCLTTKELEDLSAKGGSLNSEWRLIGACDVGDGTGTRAPLATAPEPDDRTPLEADLSLLFPWGFFMIGLRFLLRGALALGGAVSTDPNAAHGADAPVHDVANEPPIVEAAVHAEAEAHVGAGALPADDINADDQRSASQAKLAAAAENEENKKKGVPGEEPHFPTKETSSGQIPTKMVDLEKLAKASEPPKAKPKASEPPKDYIDPFASEAAAAAAKVPTKPPSKPPSQPPPDGPPTAQRLEVARQIAEEEEEERTLVGDLSELARAQELLEKQREEDEKKKKGGK